MKKYLLILFLLSFLSVDAQKAPADSRVFRPGAVGQILTTLPDGSIGRVYPAVQDFVPSRTEAYQIDDVVLYNGLFYRAILQTTTAPDAAFSTPPGPAWVLQDPETPNAILPDTQIVAGYAAGDVVKITTAGADIGKLYRAAVPANAPFNVGDAAWLPIDTKLTEAEVQAFAVELIDSTRLVSDSIMVYYQAGSVIGRDTLRGFGLAADEVAGIVGDSVSVERAQRIAALADSSVAIRADFPIDTKLTSGEVQAFEGQFLEINGDNLSIKNSSGITQGTVTLPERIAGVPTIGGNYNSVKAGFDSGSENFYVAGKLFRESKQTPVNKYDFVPVDLPPTIIDRSLADSFSVEFNRGKCQLGWIDAGNKFYFHDKERIFEIQWDWSKMEDITEAEYLSGTNQIDLVLRDGTYQRVPVSEWRYVIADSQIGMRDIQKFWLDNDGEIWVVGRKIGEVTSNVVLARSANQRTIFVPFAVGGSPAASPYVPGAGVNFVADWSFFQIGRTDTMFLSDYDLGLGTSPNVRGTTGGQKVYISTDRGYTFTQVFEGGDFSNVINSSEASDQYEDEVFHIHAIAWDPWWRRIWMTTGDGAATPDATAIWWSDDLGATWRHMLATNVDNGINTQCTSIAVYPDNVVFGSDKGSQNGLIRIAKTTKDAIVFPEIVVDKGQAGLIGFGRNTWDSGPNSFKLHSFGRNANVSLPGGGSFVTATWDGWSHEILWEDTTLFYFGAIAAYTDANKDVYINANAGSIDDIIYIRNPYAEIRSPLTGYPAVGPAGPPGIDGADGADEQNLSYNPTTGRLDITGGTGVDLPLPSSGGAWTEDSGNVSRATGNVGIGTATPNAVLDVVGEVELSGPGTSITGSNTIRNFYTEGHTLNYEGTTRGTSAKFIGFGVKNDIVNGGWLSTANNVAWDRSVMEVGRGYFSFQATDAPESISVDSPVTTMTERLRWENSQWDFGDNINLAGNQIRGSAIATASGDLPPLGQVESLIAAVPRPWTLSGNNLYPTTIGNNVGIGTATPAEKLDVIGGLRVTEKAIFSAGASSIGGRSVMDLYYATGQVRNTLSALRGSSQWGIGFGVRPDPNVTNAWISSADNVATHRNALVVGNNRFAYLSGIGATTTPVGSTVPMTTLFEIVDAEASLFTQLDMNSNRIIGLADPISALDAANQRWVQAQIAAISVDNLGNHVATQDINFANFKGINAAVPTATTDVARIQEIIGTQTLTTDADYTSSTTAVNEQITIRTTTSAVDNSDVILPPATVGRVGYIRTVTSTNGVGSTIQNRITTTTTDLRLPDGTDAGSITVPYGQTYQVTCKQTSAGVYRWVLDYGSDTPHILTATATLDFPEVATANSSDLTITVAGAVVGQPVILGGPLAPSGTDYNAQVTSAGVVTVRFYNHAAGATDPAPATFTVKVFR